MPEDFEQWVKEQKQLAENEPAAADGRLVFERTACINCHAVNGTVANGRFGPDLTHLMGRATLGSGALTNSLGGLRAGVKSPAQFKSGALMAAMNPNDADLDKRAAYLCALK